MRDSNANPPHHSRRSYVKVLTTFGVRRRSCSLSELSLLYIYTQLIFAERLAERLADAWQSDWQAPGGATGRRLACRWQATGKQLNSDSRVTGRRLAQPLASDWQATGKRLAVAWQSPIYVASAPSAHANH